MKKRKKSLVSGVDRVYWVSKKGWLTAEEKSRHEAEVRAEEEKKRAEEERVKAEKNAPKRKGRRSIPTVWK